MKVNSFELTFKDGVLDIKAQAQITVPLNEHKYIDIEDFAYGLQSLGNYTVGSCCEGEEEKCQ